MEVESVIVTIEGVDSQTNAGLIITVKNDARKFLVEIKPSYTELECFKKIDEVLKKILFKKE